MSYDVDESEEDVDIVELHSAGQKVGLVGVVRKSGHVFVSGDLHPMGAFATLMLAAKENVPYISTSSVNALFPSDWIKGACLHDPDRLRIIDNLERMARASA